MARRNHLDDLIRGKMVGQMEKRHSLTSVAEKFGINKSVASRAWKAFHTSWLAIARKVGGSCPRKITAVDGIFIVLQAKRAQYQSARVIAQPKGNDCHSFLSS
ncbi:transposable element Tcb2 transposase [Trichonephila clavipes]|uniref:Transposable element Tcb2 transposase n=1 Tax=Trichonephila clavipes TaxID=2585209 RepID=A0A8X6T688_TRICX|nr:transposable element Tcb2 transposase [Trichonephila clavipes]